MKARIFIAALIAVSITGAPLEAQIISNGVYTPVFKLKNARRAIVTSVLNTYNPRGVLIEKDMYVGTTTALGTTDGPRVTVSVYRMGTNDNTNPTNSLNDGVIVTNQATTCETSGANGTTTFAKGFCWSWDNSAVGAQLNINNAIGAVTATDSFNITGASVGLGGAPLRSINGQWDHFLVSIDTVAGLCAVVMNGVNVRGTTFSCPTNITGLIPDLNGTAFSIGNGTYTSASVMESLAEMFIDEESLVCSGVGAPATMGGITVTCSGANVIPPEMIAKFRDTNGRPVDLGPTCTGPTGRRPEVCLTGDGVAMATNKGSSAAAFAVRLSGTFAGTPLAYPSAYGPAGLTAGRPTMKWLNGNPGAGNGTTFPTASRPNAGLLRPYPIATGDLLILAYQVVDSSGSVNHALTCPTGGASTWTQAGIGLDVQGAANATVCYAFAAAGETGNNNVTWTTANTRTTGWVLANYGQVGSIGVKGCAVNGAVLNSISTPNLTTTGAGSTVVSVFTNWNAGAVTFTPPAGDEMRYHVGKSATPSQIIVTDRYGVPLASSTLATTTMSANNFAGVGCTLELRP